MADIIKLKNSNPLNKYPVDAEELNHNFEALAANNGSATIKATIESSGQVYSDLFDDQLAKAIAQYVLSASLFAETGSGANYILTSKEGLSLPYRYSYGMIVTFETTRTNAGACSLQIGALAQYPILVNGAAPKPGAIATNELISFIFVGDHWEPITTSVSGTSSSGGSSTSGNEAMVSLKNLIQTASITYDEEDTTQVSKAVSSYVLNMVYNSQYDGDRIFVLTPNGAHFTVDNYYIGMTVMFVADADITTEYPAIKINDLQPITITNHNGDTLNIGDIKAKQFCICKYFADNTFHLLSSYMPTLNLGGRTVESISNDTLLTNGSDTALVTEHAVKEYVDRQTKTNTTNTITEAYSDASGNSIALQLIGNHAVQLVTATPNEDGSYGSVVKENTPNTSTGVFASSNSGLAINAVSKANGVYWETEKEGFAIDNIHRVLSGASGQLQIEKDINEDDPNGYGFNFNDNPPASEYFGFYGLTALPKNLKIKFTDDDHTPTRILCEFNTANTQTGTWMTLVDRVTATEPSQTYGDISVLEKDSDGYYTITVPEYYETQTAILPFEPTAPFSFRILIIECDNQFPTTEQIQEPGYDPNTDTTSERYSVQISDICLGELVQAPAFTASFYSGRVVTVPTSMFYTQYSQAIVSDEPTNAVTLDNLTMGTNIIYLVNGAGTLFIAPVSDVFQQSSRPTPSASIENGVWINDSTTPSIAYQCVNVGDDTNPEYDWVETDLILLGEVTVASNQFTSLSNYAAGSNKTASFPISGAAKVVEEINHNFGGSVSVSCELQCVVPNNGYAANEVITLSPYMMTNYTLVPPADPTTDPYTLDADNSYLTISSTAANARIQYGHLKIVNKSTGAYVTVTANHWNLIVYVNKD